MSYSSMTNSSNTFGEACVELSIDDLAGVTGGGLANPDGSIILFGYGIQWTSRSICFVTPTQDTIVNVPR